jgi:hypothetical protein
MQYMGDFRSPIGFLMGQDLIVDLVAIEVILEFSRDGHDDLLSRLVGSSGVADQYGPPVESRSSS